MYNTYTYVTYTPSQFIDLRYIGEHIIDVIRVWWIIGAVPFLGGGAVTGEDVRLQFTLIINTVKSYDLQVSHVLCTYVCKYIRTHYTVTYICMHVRTYVHTHA